MFGEQKKKLGPSTRIHLEGSTGMFERYSALIRDAADDMPNIAFFAWNNWLGDLLKEHLQYGCPSMWRNAFYKLAEHYLIRFIRSVGDKQKVESVGEKVRAAFGEVFDENPWIEKSTRKFLKKKLEAMPEYIGYNDNALDFEMANQMAEMLPIPDEMSPIEQVMFLSRAFWIKENLDIGDKVDSTILVNAHNVGGRHIVIPQGILKAPFFDRDWPLETHYAGIGYVIGHEFTHTYDGWEDRGLPAGNPGNDTDEFKERHQCLIDEFGNIVHHSEFYNITVKGDGMRQRRESICDNNGLRTSFRAYRKERLRLFGKNPPKWPGLQKYTNDQLFFISLAQGWCGRISDVKRRSDDWQAQPHPPASVRLNEVMKNFEDFAAAFKCPRDSPMNPPIRCRVWRRIKKH
ncbi:unnamed protein product, partial [Mesorhabditis spiculigera]